MESRNPNYPILIVEDSDDDAFFLGRAFRKCRMANPILRVKNGLEAIAYLEGNSPLSDRQQYPFPEVLFVDLKMPRMSGFELLAWIREHPQFQAIPTIIMSSSNQTEDIQKAYHLGANTYFTKPTEMDELNNLMQTIHGYWSHGERPRG